VAVTLQTDDPATLFEHGNACFERGETDAAIAAYRRCLAGAPDRAHVALANTLHDRCEYAAAAAVYRRVLVAAPDHAGVLSSLGNAPHASGQLTDALEAHDRALAKAPERPTFTSTALL
jgi:tetratricopeptide (TPR) repeat protein